MKRSWQIFGIFVLAFGFCSLVYGKEQLTPIGFWQTTDDVTHQPSSIVEIWQENGTLKGKIVKIFEQGDHSPNDLCSLCTGDLYNKPLLGMTILSDLVEGDDGWDQGQLLSPKQGRFFDTAMKLSEDGNQMVFTIKSGVLSKTKTWTRISRADA
jgi:uncharacterized protein (DUF2147 family)